MLFQEQFLTSSEEGLWKNKFSYSDFNGAKLDMKPQLEPVLW